MIQKGPADCNKPGNAISGFNEAACDVYYGSWCPSPRDCSALVACVEAEIIEVREPRTRRAFLEYLEEAPKIEVADVGDPVKCGELREYFDYDKEYVDDLRICREVKDLQVCGTHMLSFSSILLVFYII